MLIHGSLAALSPGQRLICSYLFPHPPSSCSYCSKSTLEFGCGERSECLKGATKTRRRQSASMLSSSSDRSQLKLEDSQARTMKQINRRGNQFEGIATEEAPFARSSSRRTSSVLSRSSGVLRTLFRNLTSSFMSDTMTSSSAFCSSRSR